MVMNDKSKCSPLLQAKEEWVSASNKYYSSLRSAYANAFILYGLNGEVEISKEDIFKLAKMANIKPHRWLYEIASWNKDTFKGKLSVQYYNFSIQATFASTEYIPDEYAEPRCKFSHKRVIHQITLKIRIPKDKEDEVLNDFTDYIEKQFVPYFKPVKEC